MKSSIFYLALACSCQCFSMQPETPSVSDENLMERPLSYDEKELTKQRGAEIEEEIFQNLSIPLSRPRPIPDPGICEFYEWTYRAFRSWVYANSFRVSRADMSKVLDIIYSNMYEALDRVGAAYVPDIYIEKTMLEHTFVPANPLSSDKIDSLGEEYHKLAEDCLMTMIERVGQSPDTEGRRYLLAALKRLFFLRFHTEMIGKEFRPGYLRPGTDPEAACYGDWEHWDRN